MTKKVTGGCALIIGRATDSAFTKFCLPWWWPSASCPRRATTCHPTSSHRPQGEQWRVYKYFKDSNKTVDGLGIRNCHYTIQEDSTHANNRKRTRRLAQGEPAGGLREEGLPSQPDQLQPFGLFRVGRFWVKGQWKTSQKIEDLIQKMKAEMGFLDRDTVAKAC